MRQFQPHPIQKTAPPDMRIAGSLGKQTQMEVSFSARYAYQVDAVICALLVLRDWLDEKPEPLPRCRSLMVIESKEQSDG